MKKHFSRLSVNIGMGVLALGLLFASSAYAATPTLTLTNNNGAVTLSVTGADPNVGVNFYYNFTSGNSGNQFVALGNTDANGSLSTTFGSGSYPTGINSGAQTSVYANGQFSSVQTWPVGTPTTTTTGGPSLSQTSVTLNVGQSTNITLPVNSNSVFVQGNSNSGVANFSTNGSQITVTGAQAGATTANICYTSNSANCSSLSVVVQGSGTSAQTITFSQPSVTLSQGGSTVVTIYGGSQYYVSSNSNPSAVSGSMNGESVTLYGTAVGSATLSICSVSNGCGTLYVTVSGSGSTSGSLQFNPTGQTIAIGQTVNVNVTGGNGFYLSNNTNTGVASAALNGNAVAVTGLANGSTLITVCSTSNGCGSFTATVGSSGTSSGGVTFSPNNPTLSVGQNLNVSLSGGSGTYFISSASGGIASVNLVSNILELTGQNAGSVSITVCATSGGCGTFTVTVTPAATNVTTIPTVTPTPTPTLAPQTSSNGDLLAQIMALQAQLAQVLIQIQTMQTKLTQLTAQIGSASPSPSPAASTASGTGTGYQFLNNMSLGSKGPDVTALQKFLTAKGFYSAAITGFYGPVTAGAVMQYQTAHGITPLGNVGPSTRASLNSGQ